MVSTDDSRQADRYWGGGGLTNQAFDDWMLIDSCSNIINHVTTAFAGYLPYLLSAIILSAGLLLFNISVLWLPLCADSVSKPYPYTVLVCRPFVNFTLIILALQKIVIKLGRCIRSSAAPSSVREPNEGFETVIEM
ncbi:hypothetical protein J6590_005753 [Homalodisca vitripennis]|nr:hypothetical protein J6590_005753 [Homalodisca vitripennis]